MLMKFLAQAATRLGVAEHVYVVGGAPRNHLLGLPIKDLDLVIDSIASGRDSAWFANKLQDEIPVPSNLTTNQYGVAILSLKDGWTLHGIELNRQVLEIANARRESYGKAEGKGYKPDSVEMATIQEDLLRRDFTVNTLLWRLADLQNGPDEAQVLDLLQVGLSHLQARELITPIDPDQTFTDDPTRMLRAVKFAAKYGFKIPSSTAAAIGRNTHRLKQMPWDAVRKLVVADLLAGSNPLESVSAMSTLGLHAPIVDLLREEPGFHAGVSRGLAGSDPLLLLHLWELGYHLQGSPGSLVRQEEIPTLQTILELFPGNARLFISVFRSPPINQERIFEKFNLKGKERAKVVQLARRRLLANPDLMSSPENLEREVEALLDLAK